MRRAALLHGRADRRHAAVSNTLSTTAATSAATTTTTLLRRELSDKNPDRQSAGQDA